MKLISRISLIAAYTKENFCIGNKNSLPWVAHTTKQEEEEQAELREFMRADLQRFQRITLGKPVIMGYNTHLSIGKALPGRANIILSRAHKDVAPGCEVFKDTTTALARADKLTEGKEADGREIIIIGGAAVYAQLIDQAQRMYLTVLDKNLAGDSFFPPYDSSDWRTSSSVRCRYGAIATTFMQLDRKKG